MKRYLITYSYIGTNFRSVQKELKIEGAVTDPESLQGLLEIALQRFKPSNTPVVVVSSRTDQGVHALSTSAHVDIVKPPTAYQDFYKPEWLMHGLNRSFEKLKVDVRIKNVQIVPDTFHARYNAKSRTYLYRFAVKKNEFAKISCPRETLGYSSNIPMSEWRRCHFVHPTEFDSTLFPELSKLFLGTHNFRTFMGRPNAQPVKRETVKTILKFDIRPGKSLVPEEYDPVIGQYQFWEVLCQANSFVYRQVRRIVACVLAVAQHRITLDDVRRMLEQPGPENWSSKVQVVPPHGLYLLNVEYDPADLFVPAEEPPAEQTKQTKSPSMQALLEARKQCLRAVETRVTLPSGQVYVETHDADRVTAVQQVFEQTSPGFVVDEKPDLQVGHVLPGLLVGSQDVATDAALLTSLGVTHVLSLGIPLTPALPGLKHQYVDLLDLPESNLRPAVDQGCTFIQEALGAAGTVLVHCNAGVSRAPTMVLAYLMLHRGMGLEEALTLVKQCRPCARPNEGFLKQLASWDKSEKLVEETTNKI